MINRDKHFLLYSRDECELCEVAEQLIQNTLRDICKSTPELGPLSDWIIEKINIDSDVKLADKYGWHIPVLKRTNDGQTLFWPFPPSRCRQFLLTQ